MGDLLKKIYRNVLRALPDRAALYLIYFRGYHKRLDLSHPRYYGEKIQWLKLNGGLEQLGPFVDKYEVRKFVAKTIGEEHLFKIYGVYDDPDDIDFEALPEKFVLKCTNGSQAVIICTDKSKLDIPKARKEMRKWLNDKFYRMKKEPQYKNVRNRILIEEYMEDDSGELRDYKFYCFNGEPKWYAIFSNRFSDKTIDTYTIDGTFLPDCHNGGAGIKLSTQPQHLQNLEEFAALARRLSAPFTMVRVDFYMVNGKIYFGELTFTDGAGAEPILPLEKYDVQFGNLIPLTQVLVQPEVMKVFDNN